MIENMNLSKEMLDQQRKELFEGLKGYQAEATKTGVLSDVPESAVKIDVDFSDLPIKTLQDLDAYDDGDKYYLTLKDKKFIVYIAHVDKGDAKESAESDIREFPLLTYVGIQLALGGYEKVVEMFEDDSLLIAYAREAFLGTLKAHKNGHVNMEELMEGKISAEEAKEVMDYLNGEVSETI